MGAVQDLINKLKAEGSKANQESAILDIIANNENLIIDLNTGQLMEGKTSENEFLIDYQNIDYALMKLKLNPEGVTDLYLTGAFHRAWDLLTDDWPVTFTSYDEKKEKLTAKYGEDIFGLTPQNKKVLTEDIIYNEVVQYYRNLFQL